MSQLEKLQSLVTRSRVVEVGGETIEMRAPSAAEYRSLMRDIQGLADSDDQAMDALNVFARCVQATVRDVPDEDFAVSLIAATGGLEHSPLVIAARDILGMSGGDDGIEQARSEIEEGELGNS